MPFHFITDSSDASRQLLVMAVLLALAGGWILFYGMSKNRGFVYLLVGGLVVGLGAWQGFRYAQLERIPGQWDIRIDSGRVTWSAPQASGESSFDLEVSEIDHLEVTRFEDQSGRPPDYVIVTASDRYTLGRLSGVDLEEFARALEEAGVTHREIKELPPKK